MVAFPAFSYYKFLLLHTKLILTVIISICETFRQLLMAHDNANNVAAHHYYSKWFRPTIKLYSNCYHEMNKEAMRYLFMNIIIIVKCCFVIAASFFIDCRYRLLLSLFLYKFKPCTVSPTYDCKSVIFCLTTMNTL